MAERYVVFLRGVTPMNLKMTALRECLERAGFTDVKTILASGNAAFSSKKREDAALGATIDRKSTRLNSSHRL